MVRLLQMMMKKEVLYEWINEAKESFRRNTEAIVQVHVLVNLNFGKYFFLYTFAFDLSYATILTQKNNDVNEVPIS